MTMHPGSLDGYADFLARKARRPAPAGIEAPANLPGALKPFQRDIVVWALRRGRAAIFAGTGLGKTLQQLAWADAIRTHTGRPILILTPLGVAQQTCREAEKFGIADVAYATDHSAIASTIVVSNYERIDRFNMDAFGGIVLDESSIIKHHESKTRRALIGLCRNVPFRLCCTATPAPNDWVELGNHAEFLGVMTHKEMLSMWFVHDGSIRATNVQNHGSKPIAEWRLKGHAERDFWRWVASWAVMIRHPRDLGYEEPGYDLPRLEIRQVTVPVEFRPRSGWLFPVEARTLKERLAARRDSVEVRVKAAADIINAAPDRPWLAWCNLNREADLLTAAVPDAVQVAGSDPADVKAERLLGFCFGRPRILVSKPSIAGWGLNYQHCADMVFVGLNDSFEQLYQSIRRCWRFGQTEPVTAYLIAAETEGAVVKNLRAKEAAAEAMADAMAEHMRDLCRQEVRGHGPVSVNRAHARMEIPAWLKLSA